MEAKRYEEKIEQRKGGKIERKRFGRFERKRSKPERQEEEQANY